MPRSRQTNPLSRLKTLTPLNIRQCRTLSELVAGLKNCAFGANMLGSVIETYVQWVEEETLPIVVYDGVMQQEALGELIDQMFDVRSIRGTVTSAEFVSQQRTGTIKSSDKILVVGPYTARHASALHAHPVENILYVNKERQCTPGMARDGSFTNVCFSAPELVLPIMDQVERERHGAEPISPTAFMRSLAQYGGVATTISAGSEVARKMFTARGCKVMLTLSGAMTAAQLGGVVRVMMEDHMVHAITATGALMAHGLVEGLGLKHLMHDPSIPDHVLVRWGGNRITTVVEPESNFDVIDEVVSAVLDKISGDRPIAPSELLKKIGQYLNRHYPNNKSILGTAAKMGIPVFVPAFFDSELGNDVTVANQLRRKHGLRPIVIDQERDNLNLVRHSLAAKKLGIFTVGGGVPRNWAQNLGPLVNLFNNRAKKKFKACKYAFAVRMDPAQMDLGHLSGCTYSEGEAWGKFIRKLQKAEIANDATTAWPILVWAELGRRRELAEQRKARRRPKAV